MTALRKFLYLLFAFYILHSTFLIAPVSAQNYLPACNQSELSYMEPVSLTNNAANCPAESVCVTPVTGDVLLCNKPKSSAGSSGSGVELCPAKPALYSVTTPPGSQSCPLFKKVCYIPGSRPTYVCVPNEIKGSCDPRSDENCPSAKGVECAGGIVSALGCVKTEPAQIISSTVGIAVGMGGGISLLLMAFGAFQMITSGGRGERLKEGRDRFLAAAIGLTFITLAVFLLQIVGVDILNLPGFGG